MVRSCSAWKCSNRDTKTNRNQRISFHEFPKDGALRKAWTEACRGESNQKGKVWGPTKFSCLCSDHFTQNDFEKFGNYRRLVKNAIPSLFKFSDSQRKKNITEIPNSNVTTPTTGKERLAEDESGTEWINNINVTHDDNQRNLIVLQSNDQIYYCTTETILPHSEFLISHRDEFKIRETKKESGQNFSTNGFSLRDSIDNNDQSFDSDLSSDAAISNDLYTIKSIIPEARYGVWSLSKIPKGAIFGPFKSAVKSSKEQNSQVDTLKLTEEGIKTKSLFDGYIEAILYIIDENKFENTVKQEIQNNLQEILILFYNIENRYLGLVEKHQNLFYLKRPDRLVTVYFHENFFNNSIAEDINKFFTSTVNFNALKEKLTEKKLYKGFFIECAPQDVSTIIEHFKNTGCEEKRKIILEDESFEITDEEKKRANSEFEKHVISITNILHENNFPLAVKKDIQFELEDLTKVFYKSESKYLEIVNKLQRLKPNTNSIEVISSSSCMGISNCLILIYFSEDFCDSSAAQDVKTFFTNCFNLDMLRKTEKLTRETYRGLFIDCLSLDDVETVNEYLSCNSDKYQEANMKIQEKDTNEDLITGEKQAIGDVSHDRSVLEKEGSVYQDTIELDPNYIPYFSDCHKIPVNADDSDTSNHQQLKKKRQTYECDICRRAFLKFFNLQVHIKLHSNEKPHQCDLCDKKFSLKSNLQHHMRSHSEEKPYVCEKCGKNFKSATSVRRHIMHVHNREKHAECHICLQKFSHSSGLYLHLRTVHSDEKPYVCEACGKSFKRLDYLKIHQMIHTGEKPYKCNMCDKRFRQTNLLKNHQVTHTGEKPYFCGICEKGFSQRISFRKHQELHGIRNVYRSNHNISSIHNLNETEDNFSLCEICGKKFLSKPLLQMHLKRHADVKPYMCDICKKRFLIKAVMTAHRRSHTGERPFECDECGKKFTHISTVKTHKIWVHQKEKPYECDICFKKFKLKYKMVTHKHIHSDIQYACSICFRTFKWLNNLKVHMKQFHPECF